ENRCPSRKENRWRANLAAPDRSLKAGVFAGLRRCLRAESANPIVKRRPFGAVARIQEQSANALFLDGVVSGEFPQDDSRLVRLLDEKSRIGQRLSGEPAELAMIVPSPESLLQPLERRECRLSRAVAQIAYQFDSIAETLGSYSECVDIGRK